MLYQLSEIWAVKNPYASPLLVCVHILRRVNSDKYNHIQYYIDCPYDERIQSSKEFTTNNGLYLWPIPKAWCSDHASNLGGLGFESRPVDQQIKQWYFVVSWVLSCKSWKEQRLSCPSQFIIHNHHLIRLYITKAVDKATLNKLIIETNITGRQQLN
jgi:hypothetical protein